MVVVGLVASLVWPSSVEIDDGLVAVLDTNVDRYSDLYLFDGVAAAVSEPLNPEDRILEGIRLSQTIHRADEDGITTFLNGVGARHGGAPLLVYERDDPDGWVVGLAEQPGVVELMKTDDQPSVFILESGTFVAVGFDSDEGCSVHRIGGTGVSEVARADECFLSPVAEAVILKHEGDSEISMSVMTLNAGDTFDVATLPVNTRVGATFSRDGSTVLVSSIVSSLVGVEPVAESVLVDLSDGEVIARADGWGVAALGKGFLAQVGKQTELVYVDSEGVEPVYSAYRLVDVVLSPSGGSILLVENAVSGRGGTFLSASVGESGLGPVEEIGRFESRLQYMSLADGRVVVSVDDGSVYVIDGADINKVGDFGSAAGMLLNAVDGRAVLVEHNYGSPEQAHAVVFPGSGEEFVELDGDAMATYGVLSSDGKWFIFVDSNLGTDRMETLSVVEIGGNSDPILLYEAAAIVALTFYDGQLYFESLEDEVRQTHRFTPGDNTIEDLVEHRRLRPPRYGVSTDDKWESWLTYFFK